MARKLKVDSSFLKKRGESPVLPKKVPGGKGKLSSQSGVCSKCKKKMPCPCP